MSNILQELALTQLFGGSSYGSVLEPIRNSAANGTSETLLNVTRSIKNVMP